MINKKEPYLRRVYIGLNIEKFEIPLPHSSGGSDENYQNRSAVVSSSTETREYTKRIQR